MRTDVLVVGSGPAGLGAAVEAAGSGLKVVVVDETHRPGGRLLGQLHEKPDGQGWFNGIEEAQRLLEEALNAGVDIYTGVEVWALSRPDSDNGWVVHCVCQSKASIAHEVYARAVVLATGAAERPIPMPGWTLPGVMSIGAAQIFANVHRVRPGERALVIGINVLSLAIARELSLAGVEVVGLVLPPCNDLAGEDGKPQAVLENIAELARMAPRWWQRLGGWFGRTALGKVCVPRFYPTEGLKSWGISIQARRAALEILGDECVESVRVTRVDGEGRPCGASELISVDLVCIAGGLYPLSELAGAAGCLMAEVDELGGEVPIVGEGLETSEKGLFVAGNMTGVEGADVALAHGRLAGLSVALELGVLTGPEATQALERARAMVIDVRGRAPIRFHPDVQRGRELIGRLAQKHGVPQKEGQVQGANELF
jgi:sarcosine oxidase subunit alpha